MSEALEILKKALAEGKITIEEFNAKKAVIADEHGNSPAPGSDSPLKYQGKAGDNPSHPLSVFFKRYPWAPYAVGGLIGALIIVPLLREQNAKNAVEDELRKQCEVHSLSNAQCDCTVSGVLDNWPGADRERIDKLVEDTAAICIQRY